MNVHILITCLSPESVLSSLLVFKSLRIGFPTSNIFLYGNNLHPKVIALLPKEFHFQQITGHSHGEWIEKLIQCQREPFWICDTDVVFYDKVEGWKFDLFAGRYEPQFMDSWTNSIHMARLHPSLMWINPSQLRSEMRGWPGKHDFFSTVETNLIRWNWVPELGKPLRFYDTCAGLHHVFGGTQFTEEQNQSFAHIYCGTYAHLSPEYRNYRLTPAMFNSTDSLRNLFHVQKQWYADHAKS